MGGIRGFPVGAVDELGPLGLLTGAPSCALVLPRATPRKGVPHVRLYRHGRGAGKPRPASAGGPAGAPAGGDRGTGAGLPPTAAYARADLRLRAAPGVGLARGGAGGAGARLQRAGARAPGGLPAAAAARGG